MLPARYARPDTIDDALAAGSMNGAAFLAGGTTMIDLMKLDVLTPASLVDVARLPLAEIDVDERRARLGTTVRLSDAADDASLRRAVPAIAEALEQSASGQLRNMATLGGNVLQRTRCAYYRDVATPCNKRSPGSGCGARTGLNAAHAVLGTSERCIATHASDFAVPLVAFDAALHVRSAAGRPRSIAASDFFLVPGEHPERETPLEPGDLIVAIEVPRSRAAATSTYVKVRERTSYAFALASCAAGADVSPDGTFAEVRIALGGVATVPWRARAAEAFLRGKRATRENVAEAARAEFASAHATQQNAYKVDLGIATIVRALDRFTAR